MSLDSIANALDFVLPGLAVIASVGTLLLSLKSGILRSLKIGSIQLEGRSNFEEVERLKGAIKEAAKSDAIPFETEQLAGYYATTLGQARISFWFSLIFASIGFAVIVGGAMIYDPTSYASSGIKIVSGVIIDAVAALFFVQSRKAQESMASFFEKLRSDRQYVEARAMCDEISDSAVRDHLKTVLVLHYSGLDAGSVIDRLIHSKSAQAHPNGS